MVVNSVDYFADAEHKECRYRSADDIECYLWYLETLEKWFLECGEVLPLPCRTNYRDAWFHYRKLYEQKSYKKVVQEQYALEEHLIRSVKDAINSYFQTYLIYMENTYHNYLNNQLMLEETDKRKVEALLSECGLDIRLQKKWAVELYKKLEDHGLSDNFEDVARYLYVKLSDKVEVLTVLQQSLHMVKNYCTGLRIGGANIYRPAEKDAYFEECTRVYEKLIEDLESICIKDVICILG